MEGAGAFLPGSQCSAMLVPFLQHQQQQKKPPEPKPNKKIFLLLGRLHTLSQISSPAVAAAFSPSVQCSTYMSKWNRWWIEAGHNVGISTLLSLEQHLIACLGCHQGIRKSFLARVFTPQSWWILSFFGDLLKLIANEFISVPWAEAGGDQWFLYSQWNPFNATTQAIWAAVELDTLQSSESEPQLPLCTVPRSASLERWFRFLFVHFLYSNLLWPSKSDFPLLFPCFHESFGVLGNLSTTGCTFASVISRSLIFQIHSTILSNWKILLSNQAENQSCLSGLLISVQIVTCFA